MARLNLEAFTRFFEFYQGETHQMDAVAELWRKLPPDLLQEDSDWVVKYRSKVEPAPISVINQAGLDLIKRFEGLRLEAYLCPAGVATIGYGSTGDSVYLGMAITEKEAEDLLRLDLTRFEDCISCNVKVVLTDNEYAALVSWAFNTGCGAVKSSTLLRRLNAGEPKERVISEELMRWNKVNGEPLEGLTRRRQAEVDLALQGADPVSDNSTKLTPASSFDYRVTPNFTYGELTLGEEQRRFTSQGQCDVATELCEFLEKGRAKFGPLKITSGHRPPAVNASVGGASQSEHLYQPGCGAIDVYPINGGGQAFEDWCDAEWPYSVGYGWSYRQFTHLGIRDGRPRVRWDY